MQNIVNYLNHVIVQPDPINIRFDSPEYPLPKESSFKERASRVTQLALPILSLYQPFAQPISIVGGVNRVFIHMSLAVGAAQEKKYLELSGQLLQVALGVFLVVATFFEFKIGILINNGYDVIMGMIHIVQHLMEKEYGLAAKEALHVLASALYITFMVTGTLEYLLVMLVVQAVISLYQAKEELFAKHYPEAALCLITSFVRGFQAHKCYQQIEERNFILSVEKCQDLFNRVLKAKMARELLESELIDIEGNIQEHQVVMKDANGKEYDFGTHFHAYGKELVKGANIEFKKITIDGQDHYELDFKVNTVFQKQIEKVVNDFKSMEKGQIKAVLKAAHSKASDVVVSEGKYSVGALSLGQSHEIAVQGLGKVIIGASEKYEGLKTRVVVQMDSTKNLFDLHELLSLVNLEKSIQSSSTADIERLKIGHLYRVFRPREATPLERTEEFFTLPVEQLKAKIIQDSPEMETVFNKYLENMHQAEILPGKVRYQMEGLANEIRKEGGLFLTSAITGAYSESELFNRVQNILQMGMLSNETRASHGIQASGLSVKGDYQVGGADSVFTQMVTQKHLNNAFGLDNMNYYSDIRLIIGLEALETGTYQYHYDSYGNRTTDPWSPYLYRPGIVEFAKDQASWPTYGNEVMIKERIAPSHINGIVVRTESMKQNLLTHLRTHNLMQNKHGTETINGVPANLFIKCA